MVMSTFINAPDNTQLWVYYAQIWIWMHRLEIHASSWCTHVFKPIKIVNGHLEHQQNQISKVQNTKLCLPNHIPVCDADWFKWKFRQLYFKADWSQIHFLCFHFSWKHVAFTHAKMRFAAKSDENIIIEGERSKKQLKKILAQP